MAFFAKLCVTALVCVSTCDGVRCRDGFAGAEQRSRTKSAGDWAKLSSTANGLPQQIELQRPPCRHYSTVESVELQLTRHGTHGDKMVRLNVGGTSFRLLAERVLKFAPNSRIGRLAGVKTVAQRRLFADAYLHDSDEYFFQRSAKHFEPIYDYLCTGTLHTAPDCCAHKFAQEVGYWWVTASISPCCNVYGNGPMTDTQDEADDAFFGRRLADMRRRIWHVTEGTGGGSIYANVFELISTGFVVVSILSLILSTVPELRATEPGFRQSTNDSAQQPHGAEHPLFSVVETICIGYFSAEYLLRLIIAPDRGHFVLEPLNVVDAIAILPFYIELLFGVLGLGEESSAVGKYRWTFVVTRVLRVLRVMRVAKLSRFSPALRSFALTLRRSAAQLKMVLIIDVSGIVFFSTLVYFLEKDEPDTKFHSIPATFWWCVVTMSTVGYGDVVPQTIGGKIVSSGAIICGVLVLALPITIIVNNFFQVAKLNVVPAR